MSDLTSILISIFNQNSIILRRLKKLETHVYIQRDNRKGCALNCADGNTPKKDLEKAKEPDLSKIFDKLDD